MHTSPTKQKALMQHNAFAVYCVLNIEVVSEREVEGVNSIKGVFVLVPAHASFLISLLLSTIFSLYVAGMLQLDLCNFNGI